MNTSQKIQYKDICIGDKVIAILPPGGSGDLVGKTGEVMAIDALDGDLPQAVRVNFSIHRGDEHFDTRSWHCYSNELKVVGDYRTTPTMEPEEKDSEKEAQENPIRTTTSTSIDW